MSVETWPLRGHLWMSFAVILLLVVGVAAWSTSARLGDALHLVGHLDYADGRLSVESAVGGRVAELFVVEGQVVEAGDPLLRIDASSLTQRRKQLLDDIETLTVERRFWQAEREGVKPTPAGSESSERFALRWGAFKEDLARWEIERDMISNRRAGLAAQRAALRAQGDLIDVELIDQTTLFSRGLTPAARVTGLEARKAQVAERLARLSSEESDLVGQVAQIDNVIARLHADRRAEAAAEIAELDRRITKANQDAARLLTEIDGAILRAPGDGVVSGAEAVQLHSVLGVGVTGLTLVPEKGELAAYAALHARDLHVVSLGRTTRIRLNPTDMTTLPILSGEIMSISEDPIPTAEPGAYALHLHVAIAWPEEPAQAVKQLQRAFVPVEIIVERKPALAVSLFMRPIFARLPKRAVKPESIENQPLRYEGSQNTIICENISLKF